MSIEAEYRAALDAAEAYVAALDLHDPADLTRAMMIQMRVNRTMDAMRRLKISIRILKRTIEDFPPPDTSSA